MINSQDQYNYGILFNIKNWFSNLYKEDKEDKDEFDDEDVIPHDLWFMMIMASFSGEF